MTTLTPRQPYSPEELATLYPQHLVLEQVQVVLRHGERTPVNARFKNAGLAPYWPYCRAANEMKAMVLSADGWDTLTWKRRMQTFERQTKSSDSDQPALTRGPKDEIDAVCQPGELTDRGRETTLALGQRLRDLYVAKLGFIPAEYDSTAMSAVYLRATPIQRALESVQQAFTGLYPSSHRQPGLLPPAIVQRAPQDETLFPNEYNCKRFAELAAGFAAHAATLWNDSREMAYINKKIGKWMPSESPTIKVDSHPRLSGIMDTINSTLAHGPATKLPGEFYDSQVVGNIDRICTEEWFAGYTASNEYRKLGIGGLVGDLTQNMVKKAQGSLASADDFKISLAGCHDTTLAATVASLGVYDYSKDKWPPYTSSIAFELFKRKDTLSDTPSPNGAIWPSKEHTWWFSLFSGSKSSSPSSSEPSSRTPIVDMTDSEKAPLKDYYVRLRYNDQPLTLPYCKAAGRHLEGDESFCTLAAFKEAADSFTPKDWKKECKMNLGQPALLEPIQPPPGL